MKTGKEVSKLSGVRVRTLHHYDAIGLLKPTRVTQAGYRQQRGTGLPLRSFTANNKHARICS